MCFRSVDYEMSTGELVGVYFFMIPPPKNLNYRQCVFLCIVHVHTYMYLRKNYYQLSLDQ